MKPILLALDFSEYTPQLLQHAIDFCQLMAPHQPHLYLLHVMSNGIGMVIGDATMQFVPEIEENERIEAGQALKHWQRKIPVEISSEIILKQGDVEDLILELSESLNAEFIIMGTHGSGLLHDLFLGNVSKDIIKKSKVPVLVVPCHE